MSEHIDPRAPLDAGTVDDLIRRERERCALLCEMLAARHQSNANRLRVAGTYTTRAIWPPLKKLTRVVPKWEQGARDIEACVRSLRVVASCIRKGFDPCDVLSPEERVRITNYRFDHEGLVT